MGDWIARAVCRDEDPELFFPLPADKETLRRAKAVCRGCPVRAECLADAMSSGQDFGVFGGLNEVERRKLKSRRPARRVA